MKELDHQDFLIPDREGFVLLVTALNRALPTEQYVDILYSRWNNIDGQVEFKIKGKTDSTLVSSVRLFSVIVVSTSYSFS